MEDLLRRLHRRTGHFRSQLFDRDPKSRTDEPLVSVVMVICKVERFLAEAIERVLSQTFRDCLDLSRSQLQYLSKVSLLNAMS